MASSRSWGRYGDMPDLGLQDQPAELRIVRQNPRQIRVRSQLVLFVSCRFQRIDRPVTTGVIHLSGNRPGVPTMFPTGKSGVE